MLEIIKKVKKIFFDEGFLRTKDLQAFKISFIFKNIIILKQNLIEKVSQDSQIVRASTKLITVYFGPFGYPIFDTFYPLSFANLVMMAWNFLKTYIKLNSKKVCKNPAHLRLSKWWDSKSNFWGNLKKATTISSFFGAFYSSRIMVQLTWDFQRILVSEG